MAEAIKIEVPQSSIKFEIGGDDYVLSLSDKSRELINSQYQRIETLEVVNNQKIDLLQSKLQEELTAIPDVSDAEYKRRRNTIVNKYEQKFANAGKRADEIGMEYYMPFCDTLFGQGAGNKLYKRCGENILAVNEIIAKVMIELNKATNIVDHMDEYAKSVNDLVAQTGADKNETGLTL